MSPDIFFLVQSKGKFLNSFANENLKNQATAVWSKLSDWTPILLIITIVLGIGLAAFYYKPYNDRPGRHYKVSYWGIWGIITTVLAFIVTLLIEYLCIKTNLKSGLTSLYWMTALSNAIYCAALYFITSLVWCNFLPTNAYKFLKP